MFVATIGSVVSIHGGLAWFEDGHLSTGVLATRLGGGVGVAARSRARPGAFRGVGARAQKRGEAAVGAGVWVCVGQVFITGR